MEESFVHYRDMTVDDSDESGDIIDNSMMSSNMKNPNSSKDSPGVFIPESDYESCEDDNDESKDTHENDDEDNDVDESVIIKPKKNRVLRLLSDSESESDDSEEIEPRHLSATTRLSIFGVKPKSGAGSNSSDESDIIVSDNEEDDKSDSEPEMHPNPLVDLTNLNISPVKQRNTSTIGKVNLSPAKHIDMSVSIDSISSPRKYVRNPFSDNVLPSPAKDMDVSIIEDGNVPPSKDMDVSIIEDENVPPSNDMNMSVMQESVEIIEKNASFIVNLDSDDDVPEVVMVTPKIKNKSFRKSSQPKINEFLGQSSVKKKQIRIVFVSKQTKQNEIKKLETLRSEYGRIDGLVKSTNMERLPDNGIKLIERYKKLKVEISKQAEKVANMEIEPDVPTEDHLKSDGFISWEQLQEGTKAVKPKTFGSQALNTHMSQQILTMESLKALHSSLGTRPTDETTAKSPKNLVTELMPHQSHALAWLTWRETQQPRGGILADDMGLGKTLTMISLVLYSKENNLNRTEDDIDDDEEWTRNRAKKIMGGTLVVCPASLLSQWYNEIANHCKKHSLRAEIHHGNKRETKPNHLARNDVVITTYNIVQRDVEKNGILMRINWQRVILDEAHIVRNHKSLTASAIFKLIAHSRWCLTGTPVHNKDLDLFSLLKFLRCSPFDDIVLWKKWIDNKLTGGQERLATVMKTLMLRRTKQQLQEQNSLKSLPEKSSHLIEVTLSKREMSVYQKVLVFSKTLFAQFLHQRAEKQNFGYSDGGFQSSKKKDEYYRMHRKMVALKGLKQVKSHEILVLLLRLRQICCHPGLIHAMLEDEDDDMNNSGCREGVETAMLDELSRLNIEDDLENENIPNTNEEGLTASKAIKQVLHISNPVFDLKNKSAKIEAVIKCLEEKVFVNRNDKAIIVSQWTSMLDVIQGNLKEMGIKCLTLSGKVPVASRQEIIEKFNNPNSDFKILLLSLCAGGVGLNLVGANHLLLTDLHWNPQLEAQAQDRIYRVGQKKPVHIYKFISQETIEQTIKILQDKKLNLANDILTGAKMIHSSKLSIDDLKLMFNMH